MIGQNKNMNSNILEFNNNIKYKESSMGNFALFLYSLTRYYKKKFRVILEIGIRNGISTNAFLYGIRDRGHKNLYLYSVDIDDCVDVIKDNDLKKYWRFIKGDSKEVLWNKEIDILLIDGDHSYEGIKADYEKYEPFVKENGLILIHDVLWAHKGVKKFFWDKVKYPKSIFPLSRSGMGVITKKFPPYYDESKIKPFYRKYNYNKS